MIPDDKEKILAMRKHGMSVKDVCWRYRNRYQEKEITDFIAEPIKPGESIEDPILRKAVQERAKQRPRRRRRTKAEMAAFRAAQGEK